nr:MAG TPA: hypothetical protein [Caudoviricetes sp.]
MPFLFRLYYSGFTVFDILPSMGIPTVVFNYFGWFVLLTTLLHCSLHTLFGCVPAWLILI